MHIKPCHADKAHVGGRWDGLLFLNSSQRGFPILTTTSMKKGKLRKQTAEDTIHLEGTCTISKSLQISDFYVTLRLEAIAPRVEAISIGSRFVDLTVWESQDVTGSSTLAFVLFFFCSLFILHKCQISNT